MAIGGLAGGVIGGGLGYMTATGGFDALFGKGPKAGRGDAPWNMDIGGTGAAGYRAPLFIAEAQEYWSAQVRKDGAVLDEHAIMLEVNKRMMEEEMKAREEEIKSIQDSIAEHDAMAPQKTPGQLDAEQMASDEQKHLDELAAEDKKRIARTKELEKLKQAQEKWDRLAKEFEELTLGEFDADDIKGFSLDYLQQRVDERREEREAEQAEITRVNDQRREQSQTLAIQGRDYEMPGGEYKTYADAYTGMMSAYGMQHSSDIAGMTDTELAEFRAARQALFDELQLLINTDALKATDTPIGASGDLGGDDFVKPPEEIVPTFVEQFVPDYMRAQVAREKAEAADRALREQSELAWQLNQAENFEGIGANVPEVLPEVLAYKPPPVYQASADVMDEDDEMGSAYSSVSVNLSLALPEESRQDRETVVEKVGNVYKASYYSGEDPWR
jgi:hypothetical protein